MQIECLNRNKNFVIISVMTQLDSKPMLKELAVYLTAASKLLTIARFVSTGLNSFQIDEKISQSLLGRTRIFTDLPAQEITSSADLGPTMRRVTGMFDP